MASRQFPILFPAEGCGFESRLGRFLPGRASGVFCGSRRSTMTIDLFDLRHQGLLRTRGPAFAQGDFIEFQ